MIFFRIVRYSCLVAVGVFSIWRLFVDSEVLEADLESSITHFYLAFVALSLIHIEKIINKRSK
jgi:hypothetical protein